MLALIPDSLFPDDDNAFVTLYSYFGGANFESADAGFEEWFVLQRPSPPDTNLSEPLLMVLLGYGFAVVGLRRRRRS